MSSQYDVTYFDQLSRLLDLERAEEVERHRALVDGSSDKDLVAQGLMLPDLELADESVGFGGRMLLTFEPIPGRSLSDGFDPGANILIRAKRGEADERVRAIVTRRRRDSIQIAFDDVPPEWVRNGRVHFLIEPNDVTYRRAKSALASIKGMDKGAERRKREVLTGESSPRFTEPEPVTFARPLNDDQQTATQRSLAADDIFLVHGPPGTGKSTVLAEIATHVKGKVLATAASNSAVDHLVEICAAEGLRVVRIGHPARVAEHLHPYVLDVLLEEHDDVKVARELFDEALAAKGYARKQRQRGRSRDRFANAREAGRSAGQLFKEARELERRAAKAIIDGADVVCATLTALGGYELSSREFDLALVDEATQAIEPLALLAFLRARRVILAGDHKQLGPTVLSQQARSLKLSLFERLLDIHGDSVKHMLTVQYRMNSAIMDFPNSEMYDGKLVADPTVADRLLAAPHDQPLLFIDTAGKGFDEVIPEGTDSYANPGEVELVRDYVNAVRANGLPSESIAIIAPYSAQVKALKETITDVAIDTVDAFQGRENDLVIVSMTRSNTDGNIGFLAELSRMNVAMTRAKKQLFIVGDSGTLASHPFYQRLIEHTQATGAYRSAWEWNP